MRPPGTSFGSLLVGAISAFVSAPMAQKVLLLGLLMVSAFATWTGVHSFVRSENANEVNETIEAFIAITVGLLTMAMWLALEFARQGRSLIPRIFAVAIYSLLMIWSVGFGFGFWWHLIAAPNANETALANSVSEIEDEITFTMNKLEDINLSVENAVTRSRDMAQLEIDEGNTCEGRFSPRDEGPLTRNRRRLANELEILKNGPVKSWIDSVHEILSGPTPTGIGTTLDFEATGGLIRSVQATLDTFEQSDENERRKAFTSLYNHAKFASKEVEEISRLQSKNIASELEIYLEKVSQPADSVDYYCSDSVLAQNIRNTIEELSEPIDLTIPNYSFTEGEAAVAFAVTNLWAKAYLNLPFVTSQVSGGAREFRSSETGISTKFGMRDWISLMVAICVDVGIFYFAMARPKSRLGWLDDIGEPASRNKIRLAGALSQLSDLTDHQFRQFVEELIVQGRFGWYILQPDPHQAPNESARRYAIFLRNFMALYQDVGRVARRPWLVGDGAHARAREILIQRGWAVNEDKATPTYQFHRLARGEAYDLLSTIRKPYRREHMRRSDTTPHLSTDVGRSDEPSLQPPNSSRTAKSARHLRDILAQPTKMLVGRYREEHVGNHKEPSESPERRLPDSDVYRSEEKQLSDTNLQEKNGSQDTLSADGKSDRSTMPDGEMLAGDPDDDTGASSKSTLTSNGSDNKKITEKTSMHDVSVNGESRRGTETSTDVAPVNPRGQNATDGDEVLKLLIDQMDKWSLMIRAAEKKNDAAEVEGIKIFERETREKLEEKQVAIHGAVGDRFDFEIHEALDIVPSGLEQGRIVEVVKLGFSRGRKMLRFAQVLVSSGPHQVRQDKSPDRVGEGGEH